MRCPHCHENIRIQGKFCPRCGEQIFGLPVRPDQAPAVPSAQPQSWTPPPLSAPPPVVAPPTSFGGGQPSPAAPDLEDILLEDSPLPPAPDGGPVLDIQLEDEEPWTRPRSGGDAVGKVCPYCRFPIKAGEATQVCSDCAVPHHRDCWAENGGCCTYGCRSSPQVAGTQVAAQTAAPPPPVAVPYGGPSPWTGRQIQLPGPALALLAHELDRMATNALVYALIAPLFLLIPALIGLLAGISVLGQIRESRLHVPGASAKAWAAVLISGGWIALAIIFFLLLLGNIPT